MRGQSQGQPADIPNVNSLKSNEIEEVTFNEALTGVNKQYTIKHILANVGFDGYTVEEIRFYDYIAQGVCQVPMVKPKPEVKQVVGPTQPEKTASKYATTIPTQKPPTFEYNWNSINWPYVEPNLVLTAEEEFIPFAHSFVFIPHQEEEKQEIVDEIDESWFRLFEPSVFPVEIRSDNENHKDSHFLIV